MKKAEFYMIRKTQILIIIFILGFSNFLSFGQKNLKYKDVFKAIEEKSKEEVYSLLLVYQKQDPYFANTYLQLGIIAQAWSKDYDALTDLSDVEFFIYNTNLYYGLALSKIDQKEIRKNDKFYLNIDRFKNVEKLEFDIVRSFIQEQIDANNEYSRNVQIVTRLFNSSIHHYNNCIRIFKEINTDNNKIKDIYLTADSKFLVKLNELESSFDSTIYYLQNYQTAIKNYPIKSYNQKYKLLPIETYRLHGLTGSDFLKDEIPIWNYGTWVKDVKQILNTDIKDMRNLINISDQKLNENMSMLAETKEYRTDFVKQKVDDKLKFKIGKYDHQSLLLELFNFKESKIEYLAALKDPLNNAKDTISSFSLLQKSKYYDNLIKSKELCDSLNLYLNSQINPYDINKYNDFFASNYGGEPGLKNYLKNESVFLQSRLKVSLNSFKDYIINLNLTKDTSNEIFTYKNLPIALVKSNLDFLNAIAGNYYTVDFQENSTGDFYITGYIKETENLAGAFIAMTDKRLNIRWLKMISSSQTQHSSGIYIQAKEDGCEVLVNMAADGNTSQNQIFIFDTEGKQKDKIDLEINAFPRFFKFDEINQKYIMAFKGFKPDQFECADDEMIVIQYDGLLKQLSWKQSLKLNGTFVDMLNMNQHIFLITNFSTYQSEDNVLTSSSGVSPGKTNALLIIIDQEGKIVKEIPILSDKAFFITNSVKINSNTINLIGFKSELQKLSSTTKTKVGELIYLLLNAEGELYFDNFK